MAKVVTALFDEFETAQSAVRALVDLGISRDRISLAASDAAGKYAALIDDDDDIDDGDVKAGEGATFGAVAGALIGLGALLIPGIGPVVVGGPLLAGLVGGVTGAVAGGVTGGIAASLIKLGVDRESAGYYAEGIKRGGTVLAVETDDSNVDRVVDIIEDYDPEDLHTRTSEWRASGWTGYDDETVPLGDDEPVLVSEEDRYDPYKRDPDETQRVIIHPL